MEEEIIKKLDSMADNIDKILELLGNKKLDEKHNNFLSDFFKPGIYLVPNADIAEYIVQCGIKLSSQKLGRLFNKMGFLGGNRGNIRGWYVEMIKYEDVMCMPYQYV